MNEYSFEFVLMGIVLVLGIGALVAVRYWLKKKRAAMKAHPFKSQKWISVSVGRHRLEYRFIRAHFHKGRETRPPSIEVRLPSRSKGWFLLESESDADRRYLKWGVTRELEVQIPHIDQKFFIASPYEVETKKFLQSAKITPMIKHLMTQGIYGLAHDGEYLLATWQPFRDSREGKNLPQLDSTADTLHELGRALPPFFSRVMQPANRGFRKMHRFLTNRDGAMVCLFILFPVLAGIVAVVGYLRYNPWILAPSDALNFAALGALGLTIFLSGMRNLARKYFLPARSLHLPLIAGSLGVLLYLFGGFFILNAFQDESSAIVLNTQILRTWRVKRKSGFSYKVAVRTSSGVTRTLSIGERQYSSINLKRKPIYKIILRAGNFGVPWVIHKKIEYPEVGRQPAYRQ